MRIGKVWLDVGFEYNVDLDDPLMVDYAKQLLYEDVQSLHREGDLAELVRQRANSKLTEADIPDFIREVFDEEL